MFKKVEYNYLRLSYLICIINFAMPETAVDTCNKEKSNLDQLHVHYIVVMHF